MKKITMNENDLRAYCEAFIKNSPSEPELLYKPYSESLGRGADFEVEYVFSSEIHKPFVGMKTNFRYKDDSSGQLWIIYPEFLDANGGVIIDRMKTPKPHGLANMWILNDANRPLHRSRMKVGTEAYLTYGPYILAELIVTKIFF